MPGQTELDPSAWRLRVRGPAGERRLGLDDLAALPQTGRREVIDCTSGWASEQDWSGVALTDLLDLSSPGDGQDDGTATGTATRTATARRRRGAASRCGR